MKYFKKNITKNNEKKKLQQMGSLKTTKYMIINKFNKLQNKQFTYTKNRLNTYTLLNLHTRHTYAKYN